MSDLVGNPEDPFSCVAAHICCTNTIKHIFEPHHDKTNNVVSQHIRHKSSSTSTEDGQKLKILDLEGGGIVLSM